MPQGFQREKGAYAYRTAGGDVNIGAAGKYVNSLVELELSVSLNRYYGPVTLHVRDVRSGRVLTTKIKPRAIVGPAMAQWPGLGDSNQGARHGGVEIIGVNINSLAAELGIASGDVLRTIDGQNIENAPAAGIAPCRGAKWTLRARSE